MSESKNYLEILEQKISNPIWLTEQDSEFAEALKAVVSDFKNAARLNILMVNLFNEYGYAMNAIFESADATENGELSNTNFSDTPPPANRAKRRASKRRTPLNLAE